MKTLLVPETARTILSHALRLHCVLRHVRIARVRARRVRRPVDVNVEIAHCAVGVGVVLEPDLVRRGAVPVRLELALKGGIVVAHEILHEVGVSFRPPGRGGSCGEATCNACVRGMPFCGWGSWRNVVLA